MSAFSISPQRLSGTELRATIEVDPRQPYLDDHRPGGHPLLGTVMGIEAMLCTALLAVPGAQLRCIECVENFAPFILGDEVEPMLEATASVAVSRHDEWTIACSLGSRSVHGEPLVHFRSRILLDRHTSERLVRVPASPPPDDVKEVNAREIYALFFHGPSFRVIGCARWYDNRMYARLAKELSPLLGPPLRAGESAPQLVEFALQCAGLFEIASNRRMMIPHAIERIERYSKEDADTNLSLWAVAERSHRPRAAAQDLDICVVDDEGNTHLRVTGYRTLPLPFSIDTVRVAALHDRFA